MAVQISRYRVLARADIRHAARVGLHALSEDGIKQAFAEGVVCGFEGDPLNECTVEIEVRRQATHRQELDEIAQALERAGYTLVRVGIEDWAADLVAERIASVVVSLGAGRALSKHPLFTIASAAFGIALVELLARSAEAKYQAWRRPTGHWATAEVPRETQPAPAPVMLPA